MDKKFPIPVLLLMLSTMFLAACRSSTPSQVDCSSAKVLCVGLVTGLDGVKDKSFNQSAWEGLLEAQKQKVVGRVQFIETVDAKDYDQNISTLTAQGYDVIVTVGEALGEATVSGAKKSPDTLFIGVEQKTTETLPNLVGLVFHEDQAGFLAGALAAQLSKTDTVATIGSSDASPDTSAYAAGFASGARYINPDIHVITAYHPNAASDDASWGASAATQAIQEGADVIFGVGGKTGEGALIKTASYPQVYCIGAGTDQWETIPQAQPCLVSSATKLVSQGILNLIKLAKEGTFPRGSYYGATELAPFHNFDTSIPQTVSENLDQVIAGLKDGSITTGTDRGK